MVRTIVVTFGVALLLQSPPILAKPDLLKTQTERGSTEPQLFLQADELVDDSINSRIVIQGNVQVTYKNYSINANNLTYDRKSNSVQAFGNVRIIEPDGAEVTADWITLTDDLRDGFLRSFEARTRDALFTVKRVETR